MQILTKEVSRQDANFKLSPSTSNETSINLSRDISNLVSDESGEVTFKIIKADFIKALSVLCLLPKVYHKKEENPSSVNLIFQNLYELIERQFKDNETAFYTVSHLKRDDGRYYLNNLKKLNGFNIRAFLIEQYSFLTFIKNETGELTLRLETIVPKEDLSEEIKETIVEDNSNINEDNPLQIIYYGAPGTGKSYTIDSMTTEENSVRTTFHPDSDYASFVGAYKPTMEEMPLTAFVGTDAHFAVPKNGHPGTEKKIVYKYVPQAFLKAYVEAWKRYAGEGVEKETFDLPLYQNNNSAKDNEENKSNGISSYYLIIEEINRGNCAQIFGDLFQLLDRNNIGSSSYPIHADDDIARFLKEDEKGFAGLTESQRKAISDFVLVKDSQEEKEIGEDILNGKLLLLPPNLHIWATMNTSDQSLFPIDSAFKRRWDWEYTPISYNPKDKNTGEEINWTFEAGGNLYSWGEFLSKINPEIESLTESADKQMGYFFAKANPATGIISEKIFINKVLFYLWTEVLKDFDMGNGIFKNPDTNKSFKFTDFFDKKQNAVLNFLQNLKLLPIDYKRTNIGDEEIENTENEEGITQLKEWRLKFWEKVQQFYRESGFDFMVNPTTRNYYQMTTGVIDLNFINNVNKRDGSCWVGLYFEAKRANELYPKLLAYKEVIENIVPFNLDWIPNDESHGYASVRVSKSGINFDNQEDIENTVIWMVEHGIKIFNAFQPYFDKLK